MKFAQRLGRRRTKVAFLVFNLDGMGGTSRSAITQANALARRGNVEVQLVSVTRSAETPHYAIDPSVTVTHLADVRPGLAGPGHERASQLVPKRWDGQFSRHTDRAMREFLPTLAVDVLVSVTPGLMAAAVQLCRDSVRIVHQEHRSSADRGGGMEPLLAYAPQVAAVALLTRSAADWLGGQLSGTAPELLVVPNPLPTEPQPRSALDERTIVAAGRIVEEKQFYDLLQAFASVAEQLPGWRLRILGDGPLREELVAHAAKKGLADRVDLPGAVTDMRPEWAGAAVCALSSRTEGFPLVAQEAMSAGVPVLTYDCPSGPRELVEDEVSGLLVGAGSVTGLAAGMVRLADDDLRVRLGAGALAASHAYDADTIAARWEEIFEGVLDPTGAPPIPPPFNRVQGPVVEVTPEQVRAEALRLLLVAAGKDHFVIPGEPPTVVVDSSRREAVLAHLAEHAPEHLSLFDPGMNGWPERRATPGRMAELLGNSAINRLLLTPWPRHEGRRTHLAVGGGAAVEFWDRVGTGDLVAPLWNRFVKRVPAGAATATATVAGVEVRTLPLMAEPSTLEVSFDVDVVYTWVDDADPGWNAARLEREGSGTRREAAGEARFRSRDELRHSLRSVYAHAPWVRTIHLVTAGQRPEWLADDPRVRLVDHRDILPPEALPTFNSQAIETALHRIPGLSEHFVYLNDDVFLGRPVRKETFFSPGGSFAAFVAGTPVGLEGQADKPYQYAALNNRALLREALGVTSTRLMAHTPHPHRVSVLREIEARFGEAVRRTALSPFRSPTDISLLSNLAQHYGLATGTAHTGRAEHAFVDLSHAQVTKKLAEVAKRELDFFCLGDHHDFAVDPEEVDAALAEFLAEYFPVRAPWELPGA